jgi:flagellar protein FlgJ
MKVEAATLTNIQPKSQTEDPGLRKASKEFEAFFLGQILKDMRRTVPESGLLGQGPEENMMRDLLDDEWAKQMAQGRGIGLAQVLYRQLMPQQ